MYTAVYTVQMCDHVRDATHKTNANSRKLLEKIPEKRIDILPVGIPTAVQHSKSPAKRLIGSVRFIGRMREITVSPRNPSSTFGSKIQKSPLYRQRDPTVRLKTPLFSVSNPGAPRRPQRWPVGALYFSVRFPNAPRDAPRRSSQPGAADWGGEWSPHSEARPHNWLGK